MPPYATVDEYIAAQPAEAQPRLHELRAAVRDAVPAAAEIISYAMPAYRLPTGTIAYFGAARKHCALYGAVGAAPEDLSAYEVSKGAIRFPLNTPIPADLVQRLVRARAAEREAARAERSRR